MRRRDFISLRGGVAAAWPLAARAKQPERMRRIGVLYGGVSTDVQAQAGLARFRRAFEELGWAPGRNIEIEYRFAAGDTDRIGTFAKELADTQRQHISRPERHFGLAQLVFADQMGRVELRLQHMKHGENSQERDA
jgi:hypothetical protein